MKRIFGFATGGILKSKISKNSSERDLILNYLKKSGISGIEFSFGRKKELYSFKLSEELKLLLKQFDYLSLHSPFRLITESKNKKEVIKQLDIIAKLYKKIGAKNVIIHPDNLSSSKILKSYNFNISTENLPKKYNITISDLKIIFKKYPKLGFCLDITHAFSFSKYETSRLIKEFGNKITQIHFSCHYKGKDHQSLKTATKEFLFSIQPIKKINVPIIIETGFEETSLKLIKEEIEYVKKFFL